MPKRTPDHDPSLADMLSETHSEAPEDAPAEVPETPSEAPSEAPATELLQNLQHAADQARIKELELAIAAAESGDLQAAMAVAAKQAHQQRTSAPVRDRWEVERLTRTMSAVTPLDDAFLPPEERPVDRVPTEQLTRRLLGPLLAVLCELASSKANLPPAEALWVLGFSEADAALAVNVADAYKRQRGPRVVQRNHTIGQF